MEYSDGNSGTKHNRNNVFQTKVNSRNIAVHVIVFSAAECDLQTVKFSGINLGCWV